MGMETPIFRKAGDVIESVIAWDVLQISARRLLSKKDFKEHQTIIKPYRAPPNSILGPHERSKPHMKLPFEGGNVTAVLPTSCHYSMQKGCSLWQSQAPQLLSYSYQCIRKVHEHRPDIFHSSFWACWPTFSTSFLQVLWIYVNHFPIVKGLQERLVLLLLLLYVIVISKKLQTVSLARDRRWQTIRMTEIWNI